MGLLPLFSRRRLRWSAAATICLVSSWLLARAVEPRALLAALGHARPLPLIVASLLVLVACMGASCLRLHALLARARTATPVGAGALGRLYVLSSAAQCLLPGPAAELIRTRELARAYAYRLRDLVAAQLAEKVIDALGLLLLCTAALLVRDGTTPPWPALLALAGALACLARVRPDWSRALGWSLVNDLAHALSVGLVLRAVGLELAPSAWVLAMVAARAAALIPGAPGQLGVLEASLVGALHLEGADLDRALATALLYRMVHSAPLLLAGLALLRPRALHTVRP